MASTERQPEAPSVSNDDAQTQSPPRVIPSNQVVILRESELDCDLATAIQRVRQDSDTSRSRILIVGTEEPATTEVRPEIAGLPIPSLPMSIGQVARSGGESALREGADRLALRLQSLQRFFAEILPGLDDLEEEVVEGSRARLTGRLRVIRDIVDWMQATGRDLEVELDGMAAGFRLVDAEELCQEIQGQVESFFPNLRVNVAAVDQPALCWGRATELAEGFFLAAVLTAHRIGGNGSVNFQFNSVDERLVVRVLGLGEPTQLAAPEPTRRFREIMVTHHRGHVVPDSMGPFGTGLVIELPTGP
jgi:hypothetical protein